LDDLARFIVDRVKCRIHPYIPQDSGWRHYPPHVAKLLESLEPLHVIAITPTWVGIDGVYVVDVRGMHDKYEVALEAVEAVFGETVEREGGGNVELMYLSTGLWAMSYFRGSVWFLSVCTDLEPYPSRFAFIAEPDLPCAWSRYSNHEEGKVRCVVATEGGAKAWFPASTEFFRNPEPVNAREFGDILFLTQMGDGWTVDREIDVDCRAESWEVDPYAYVASVLRNCPGLKSLIRHARIELLLRDGGSDWRSLLKAVEGLASREEQSVM